MDLIKEQLGQDAEVKLSVAEGKIVLEVKFSPAHLLDKAKTLIPGAVDDALIEALKSALQKTV